MKLDLINYKTAKITALILSVGIVFRVCYFFMGHGFFLDEISYLNLIVKKDLLMILTKPDAAFIMAPPVYTSFLKLLFELPFDKELIMRSLSLLCSIAALFMFFRTLHRHFSYLGVFPLAIFAIAPLPIFYAGDGKPYSFILLIGIICLSLLLDIEKKTSRTRISIKSACFFFFLPWLSPSAFIISLALLCVLIINSSMDKNLKLRNELVWICILLIVGTFMYYIFNVNKGIYSKIGIFTPLYIPPPSILNPVQYFGWIKEFMDRTINLAVGIPAFNLGFIVFLVSAVLSHFRNAHRNLLLLSPVFALITVISLRLFLGPSFDYDIPLAMRVTIDNLPFIILIVSIGAVPLIKTRKNGFMALRRITLLIIVVATLINSIALLQASKAGLNSFRMGIRKIQQHMKSEDRFISSNLGFLYMLHTLPKKLKRGHIFAMELETEKLLWNPQQTSIDKVISSMKGRERLFVCREVWGAVDFGLIEKTNEIINHKSLSSLESIKLDTFKCTIMQKTI